MDRNSGFGPVARVVFHLRGTGIVALPSLDAWTGLGLVETKETIAVVLGMCGAVGVCR